MRYRILGRTGLRVSVMGLGAGGPSRLGSSTHCSKRESLSVIQRALELGVNFFDTAENYGTEEILGTGLSGVPRDSIVISTKYSKYHQNGAAGLRESLENSLRSLGTDYIDVYNLHGVRPDWLERSETELYPELERMRDAGMIRFIGITEAFEKDTQHETLSRAVPSGMWDVVMVGYNLLNQSARKSVFPAVIEHDIGTQIMFAVRRALSNPSRLKEVLEVLIENGEVDPDKIDSPEPLDFLAREGVAESVVEAAYRFCIHEPGCDVILTGTGNVHHLEKNLACAELPPLPDAAQRRIQDVFGKVYSASGS